MQADGLEKVMHSGWDRLFEAFNSWLFWWILLDPVWWPCLLKVARVSADKTAVQGLDSALCPCISDNSAHRFSVY